MKLLEALELNKTVASGENPPARLLLACGFTPLHLATLLEAHVRLRAPDRDVEIRTGLFGDLAGTLEKEAPSDLDGIAIVIEWEDLDPRLGIRRLGGWLPSGMDDVLDSATRAAERLVSAVASLDARPIAVVPPTLPLPPMQHEPPWQLGAVSAGLFALAARLADRLAGLPGVRVAHPRPVSTDGPAHDPRATLASGFPYTLEHADGVARSLAQLLSPPAPKKGLITDLDDTVWAGILGEVGVDGVAWGLDEGAQLHGLYQQLLAALAESGVLIAVASKNDPELVERTFVERETVLPKDVVWPFEVGWGPKSDSVARILAAWNIGADAVVFVDDSAMELAEVAAAHPAVECIEFPKRDAGAALELFARLRSWFGRDVLTEEDAIRRESLRAGSAFRRIEGGAAADLDDFLRGAEAEIHFELVAADDERAFQLLNKTNQFNLNGRRLTEAEWQARLGETDRLTLAVTYRDRFGPLGKIAVLSGRRAAAGIRVDSWVMSCRAFARRIEHACLERLFEEPGVDVVTLEFDSTERNGPLRDFIGSLREGGVQSLHPGDVEIRREDLAARGPALYHRIRGVDE